MFTIKNILDVNYQEPLQDIESNENVLVKLLYEASNDGQAIMYFILKNGREFEEMPKVTPDRRKDLRMEIIKKKFADQNWSGYRIKKAINEIKNSLQEI